MNYLLSNFHHDVIRPNAKLRAVRHMARGGLES
jgi:hypothetical protein